MSSISADTATKLSRNRTRRPNLLFTRSGPVSRQEFNQTILFVEAALATLRDFTGLFRLVPTVVFEM